MKITELNVIEFGGVKDKRIALSDGLNVISGDNETGKSTLLLFIKFIFYGIPKRTAKGTDRERSLSWSGHRAAGTLTLESNEKKYEIARNAVAASKLSETLKITDLQTGVVIDGDPSELFLGVPADVFESSCCISQLKAAELSRSGAAKAIENMVSTADESIDVKKILERIDEVRKEYKLNRGDGGCLYDTEREISQLRARQRNATEKYLSFNEASARLEKKQEELTRCKAELDSSEQLLRDAEKAKLVKRFDELSEKKQELENRKSTLSELEASMRSGDFIPNENHTAALKNAAFAYSESLKRLNTASREYEDTCSSVSDEAAALAAEGERLEADGGKERILSDVRAANKKARNGKVAAAVLLPIALLCIVLAAFWAALVHSVPLTLGFGALGMVCAFCGIVLLCLSRKAIKARDAVCSKYASSFGELEQYLSSCAEAIEKKRADSERTVAARTRMTEAKMNADTAKERLKALLSLSLDCGSEDGNGLTALADTEASRLYNLCNRRREASNEIYALEKLIENDTNYLSQYDEKALRASLTADILALTPEKLHEAERRTQFNKAKADSLDREVRNLSEELAGCRAVLDQSPLALADKIEELEKRLAADTAYYDALVLAKTALEQASTAMSGNVTPKISQKAGEMLSLLSDGKHTSVRTTKELALSVEQDGFPVDAELLSGGTRDAAYICLRLSLLFRIFENELPPLIMDEAMCQLDDSRAATLLQMLGKFSEDLLQCIIFTCHSREAELCRRLNVSVNEIRLS